MVSSSAAQPARVTDGRAGAGAPAPALPLRRRSPVGHGPDREPNTSRSRKRRRAEAPSANSRSISGVSQLTVKNARKRRLRPRRLRVDADLTTLASGAAGRRAKPCADVRLAERRSDPGRHRPGSMTGTARSRSARPRTRPSRSASARQAGRGAARGRVPTATALREWLSCRCRWRRSGRRCADPARTGGTCSSGTR